MELEAGITAMDGLSIAFTSRRQEYIVQANRSITKTLNEVNNILRGCRFRKLKAN
jgi:hypothetical protein